MDRHAHEKAQCHQQVGKKQAPVPGKLSRGNGKASNRLASMTTAAPVSIFRLLVRASWRANHVTPVMYSPTTTATCTATGQRPGPAALQPSSTLRLRHSPIPSGPIHVRFNQTL